MAVEGPLYVGEDEQYGRLMANVLNPPDQTSQAQGGAGTQPPTPAVEPRPAAAALAQTQSQAPAAPSAPAVKPSAPTPTSVTPSGAGPTAVRPAQPDPSFYQRAQEGALDAMTRSRQATDSLQNQPSATSQNATLEQRRQALAAPIPYRDQTTGKVLTSATDPVTGEQINPEKLYKPGIGTRIVRGIDAVRKGGALAAFDPAGVGGTSYSDPNRNYQAAEAQRQAAAGQLSQEEQRNIANEAADTNRLKGVSADLRATATGYQDVAKTATAQQQAQQKAEYNQQLEQIKQQLADQKADPLPKTDIELVMKLASETDPAKRKMYTQALQLRRSLKEEGADAAAERANTRNDNANARAGKAAIDRAGVAKNNAVAKAQALLDKAPNSKVNQKAAMDSMQNAQDAYEQELTGHGQTPEHLTVGPDLVWRDSKGNAVSHNQASAPTATQPAAATQNPTASANPAKRSNPPVPTTAPPSGAAGMRQAKDGQYYYVDGQGRAISAVK